MAKKKATKKELEEAVKNGKNLQPKNNSKKNHEPETTIFKTLPSSSKTTTEEQLWKRLEEQNTTIGRLQKELEQKNDTIESITFQTLLTKAYSQQLETAINKLNILERRQTTGQQQ